MYNLLLLLKRFLHACLWAKFPSLDAAVQLVRQEVEFINMETKVFRAPEGEAACNWGHGCGALSRQSAFVVAGFQPLCQPFNKGT